MKTKTQRFLGAILDIFFPNQCCACKRPIPMDETFCKECEEKLEYLPDLSWKLMFPQSINGKRPDYDYANAVFLYAGTAKQAILGFKDHFALPLADYAAERLSLKLDSDGIDDIDLVTCVPIHRSKKLRRGYDQAERFAKAMAEVLGKEHDGSILGHTKSRVAQHQRGMTERFESAEKTYFLREDKPDISGRHILICDDIFTTGATINKCASLLKQAGAEKVSAVTICLTDSLGLLSAENIQTNKKP